ncbi:MAG: F0F1 ATP synthase subunit B [Dehalococcoidia bacterium]
MEQLGFHIPTLVVYIVNFVILLGLLYLFGYKPLLRIMDQRAQRIREGLEAAERAREEAAQARQEMEHQMRAAHQEGQALMEQARQMAERYREEERAKAQQEVEAFLAKARESIQRERDAAIEEVQRHFAELAILAAERVVERSLDRAAHRHLIDKVLEEAQGLGKG